jgi:MSHA pilin protein MshC
MMGFKHKEGGLGRLLFWSTKMMCKNLKSATGFTLIELVMVIVILSILSVVALPKFWNNSTFYARGFADEVLATLRYAQKIAIAQHQTVCAVLTASSVTLKDASCTTVLSLPNAQINAKSGVTLSPAMNLTFDALGRASASAEITISDVTAHIFVEQETGYVHQ